MKVSNVLREGAWSITHDPDYDPCGEQGLYTISKAKEPESKWQYYCYFPAALEAFASKFVPEDLELDNKLFRIQLKINEILEELPEEWKNKYNPKYKLQTWH